MEEPLYAGAPSSWKFTKDHGSQSVPLLMDIDQDGLMDLLVFDLASEIDLYKNVGNSTTPLFEL